MDRRTGDSRIDLGGGIRQDSICRMNERDMMHGKDWNEVEDLAGFLATEKLDGVRAYWDGSRLWTRGGAVIAAPERITSALPAGVHLDGELWAGRGRFEEARLAVQCGRWTARCRLAVFDAPKAPGGFADRLAFARREVDDLGAVFVVAAEVLGKSGDAVRLRNRVQRAGGEGLVCFDPAAPYRAGRVGSVVKVK